MTAIDQENNAIIVGTKEAIYGDELIALQFTLIAIEQLQQPITVKAKIIYLHTEA